MAKQKSSAQKSALEHGGDTTAAVGAPRLRPMQEVINNSPRPKRGRKKKEQDMADPSTSKDRLVLSRSKEGRKSQTPSSKGNGTLVKDGKEKDGKDAGRGHANEGSEESNIDDQANEEIDDDEESEEEEESSEYEEVLGEGMYEVEAIRKKRTRKVLGHIFSSAMWQTSKPQPTLTAQRTEKPGCYIPEHVFSTFQGRVATL